MARAAVRGRLAGPLPWLAAQLIATRDETATARTLVLQVPDWPEHLAGQHVDVRLTAEDGYAARRSYSIASPPDGDLVELTVQLVPAGEVSSFLARDFAIGDAIELRGPLGGWFVWSPASTEAVLLIAGGSGVVPLMAMLRARRASGSTAPFSLVYSVRRPDDAYYRDELADVAEREVRVTTIYTRSAPQGGRRPHRVTGADLPAPTSPPARVYVCGPTGFVEAVTTLLIALGHNPKQIRTERFGPSGEMT